MQHDGIFIIFGITGDLAKRKLLPALYRLTNEDLLSKDFKILGTTRRDTTVDDILDTIETAVIESGEEVHAETMLKLRHSISLVHMNIGDQNDYERLKAAIHHVESMLGQHVNRLYYLAVPPEMFDSIINGLGTSELNKHTNDFESRLLIEKPFGHDVASAQELIDRMKNIFDEDQIYRVDHYLAKETAQNILRFRFDNPMIQAVWEHADLDHILVTAAEQIGIEGRVNFYENVGALRDLIQSHLMQLLALVTMDQPRDHSASALHEAKLKVLQAIKPITADQVSSYAARGQYDTYKQEVGNPDSLTETYAAIRLDIDNDRWRDVPVLLRAGKAVDKKVTEICLIFRRHDDTDTRNVLSIKIQPNEGIVLHLLAKKPSLHDEVEMVEMDFFYKDYFDWRQPDAYERVLIDAIRGDKTLFTTDQEVLVSWKIVEEVLNVWAKDNTGLETYPTGSAGPNSIDKLAETIDAEWFTSPPPPKKVNG